MIIYLWGLPRLYVLVTKICTKSCIFCPTPLSEKQARQILVGAVCKCLSQELLSRLQPKGYLMVISGLKVKRVNECVPVCVHCVCLFVSGVGANVIVIVCDTIGKYN